MKHISLFSGIGGFDLAAEWVGWENLASCEIADFPRKVLQHHFPKSYHHDDIHTLNYEKLDYELKKRFGDQWRSDDIVLSGGFPCQPYSVAGKRLGKNDSRHLWPEMLRIIREIKPTWVVGENVRGLISWNAGLVFDEVQSDLEAEGYCVQAFVLPAAGVNAPHRRDRVWFVAYSVGTRTGDKSGEFNGQGRESSSNRKSSIYENGSVSTSGHNATSANDGLAKNTDRDGREREFRKSEPSQWEFGNPCSRNNESISSDDGETGVAADTEGGGWGFRATENIGETSREINPLSDEAEICLQQFSADSPRVSRQSVDPGTREEVGQRWDSVGNISNHESSGRWENFPTVSPIHRRDDGLPKKLAIFVVKEVKDEISKTSERNRIQNLQEVWQRVQQEEVWEKIRRLYSLESKDLLFQAMQLYSSDTTSKVNLSPFSEEVSKEPLLVLRKYGEFASSPQGKELEKQRREQFADSLWFLPHEVALAARAFTHSIRKFEAWHRTESIRSYGNAVVPQVVYQIFKAIKEYNNMNKF